MKNLSILFLSIAFLSACSNSPPKVKEPKGDWIQINNSHYYEENAKQNKKGN
ncbi:hypothetical protein [Volucribacter amazonae]|uniref:hypothetical protein n=1 Tax=Volucribacter amazonae TaxID=256731 RepID=UPI0024434772|nr:hypothetical protein [Volucribacter amazonae]